MPCGRPATATSSSPSPTSLAVLIFTLTGLRAARAQREPEESLRPRRAAPGGRLCFWGASQSGLAANVAGVAHQPEPLVEVSRERRRRAAPLARQPGRATRDGGRCGSRRRTPGCAWCARRDGLRAGRLLLVALGALVAVAAVARLAGLGEIPRGINADEGNRGAAAISLLSGDATMNVFGTGWYYISNLYFCVLAVVLKVLGVGFAQARALGALSSLLTFGVVTWIGFRHFGARFGLLTAVLAATLGLSLQFARETTEATPTALLWAASVALLLEAARSGRTWPWVAAGVTGALSVYFYPTGKAWFALAAAVCAHVALQGARRRRQVLAGTVALAAGALATVGPFLANVATHPGELTLRARQTSVFDPENAMRLAYYDPKLERRPVAVGAADQPRLRRVRGRARRDRLLALGAARARDGTHRRRPHRPRLVQRELASRAALHARALVLGRIRRRGRDRRDAERATDGDRRARDPTARGRRARRGRRPPGRGPPLVAAPTGAGRHRAGADPRARAGRATGVRLLRPLRRRRGLGTADRAGECRRRAGAGRARADPRPGLSPGQLRLGATARAEGEPRRRPLAGQRTAAPEGIRPRPRLHALPPGGGVPAVPAAGLPGRVAATLHGAVSGPGRPDLPRPPLGRCSCDRDQRADVGVGAEVLELPRHGQPRAGEPSRGREGRARRSRRRSGRFGGRRPRSRTARRHAPGAGRQRPTRRVGGCRPGICAGPGGRARRGRKGPLRAHPT